MRGPLRLPYSCFCTLSACVKQRYRHQNCKPNRHGDYAHALRKMVGESTLDELFFSCFAQGLVYVIQSGRYLYPTAITIYNHYAQLR